MLDGTLVITAFTIGLLGGLHCLGMCGSVVTALSFATPLSVQQNGWKLHGMQWLFNLGRISTYGALGLFMGALGWLVSGQLQSLWPIQTTLLMLAGTMMILMGLAIGGWWNALIGLERLGSKLWQYIKPNTQQLHIQTPWAAYGYGLLWGFLPCGLVYSTLIFALSAGGAWQGAVLMLSFGLGTLPNVLLMSSLTFILLRLSRNRRIKQFSGLLLIGFGIWQWRLVF